MKVKNIKWLLLLMLISINSHAALSARKNACSLQINEQATCFITSGSSLMTCKYYYYFSMAGYCLSIIDESHLKTTVTSSAPAPLTHVYFPGTSSLRSPERICANDAMNNTYCWKLTWTNVVNSFSIAPEDTDNDGTPDWSDTDDDNDGVLDTSDNCPVDANTDQLDADGDAQGNACDPDDDNDGIADDIDPDDDNDNYSDAVEAAVGNNPFNAFDPLHVAPGVGYILGMDDRNFGTASFDSAVITGMAWDGAGNFIKTGTMERLHEVVASANTDFCGIGALGVWCWWWAMDNGVVESGTLQPVQINGTTYSPFHDQSGYLLYESSPGVWLSAITDAVKISSDNNTHTCVISKTQGVYCWAADSFTDTVASTVPANLKNTSSVTDIAVGSSHACVINSGAVQCWGGNTLGQTAVPVVVSAPQKITSGSNHSCAINGDGRVSCWGDNSLKQRGDRNNDGYVDGVTNALRIAAGDNHTCALTGSYVTGGTSVQCWGDNGVKQSTPPRSLTNGSTTPIDVRAAGNQNCAVLAAANIASAASLTCWPAVLK